MNRIKIYVGDVTNLRRVDKDGKLKTSYKDDVRLLNLFSDYLSDSMKQTTSSYSSVFSFERGDLNSFIEDNGKVYMCIVDTSIYANCGVIDGARQDEDGNICIPYNKENLIRIKTFLDDIFIAFRDKNPEEQIVLHIKNKEIVLCDSDNFCFDYIEYDGLYLHYSSDSSDTDELDDVRIDFGRMCEEESNEMRVLYVFPDYYLLNTGCLRDIQILRDTHIPIQEIKYTQDRDVFSLTLQKNSSYEFEIDEDDDMVYYWLILHKEKKPAVEIKIDGKVVTEKQLIELAAKLKITKK